MIQRICLGIAALMGAAGVALAALAAHVSAGSGLDAASHLLLFHAVAVMAAVGLSDRGMLSETLGWLAIIGWALGACLFAIDVGLRAYAGGRLFPMAAPIGGAMLILSWLVMGAATVAASRKAH